MADMMDTLKGILGDGAEDKIKSAVSALSGGSTGGGAPGGAPQITPENMEYIMKIKNLADELSHPNDARSQLLMSLKPYMRSERQKGIDNAVRILNLTKLSGLFR